MLIIGGSAGTGVDRTGSVGEPPAAGPARLTRPTDAENPGTDSSIGRRSGEAAGDALADDAPWSRAADGVGVRVGNRNGGAFSLWQTDRQLRRSGSDRRVQWRSSSTGTHQQARQRAAPVSAGGSGTGHGAQPTGVAQYVLPPCHATRTEDRESSDGKETGGASVLDVAPGPRLRPVAEARFARGRARKSPWCAVNHRRNDWASRSPSRGEFEQVIMIAVRDRRDGWVGLSS